MVFCPTPFSVYRYRGHSGVFNPDTGQVDRTQVACGHCPSCIAGRKNDWTGRLCAEALKAKEVYFLTLTYKHEPEDFRYRDVQLMLYTLRTHFARHGKGQRIRFFCVGERGNRFGRIHWHMLIFADAPLGWTRWGRETHPGQLWPFWEWGWTDLVPVPRHEIVGRVRYCAKYAVKKIGDENSCRARFSLKPMIGGEYILDHAIRTAEAGLPLRGFYSLPGHVWTKGPRAGQQVKYRLKGASARMACDAYMDVWERLRPDRPWYPTNFLDHYGSDTLLRRIQLWPETKEEFDFCREPLQDFRITYVAEADGRTYDYVEPRVLGRHVLLPPPGIRERILGHTIRVVAERSET